MCRCVSPRVYSSRCFRRRLADDDHLTVADVAWEIIDWPVGCAYRSAARDATTHISDLIGFGNRQLVDHCTQDGARRPR
jgi:hypothetical protein